MGKLGNRPIDADPVTGRDMAPCRRTLASDSQELTSMSVTPSSRHCARMVALALLLLALIGCSSITHIPDAANASSHDNPSNYPARWPLKFKAHYFGVATYSTYECEVLYAGRGRAKDPQDELQTSSESLGDKYPDNMRAGWGPIRNFPPPARVTWRSRDGTPLEAEVDIGEIFKDELIHHNVPKDEADDPATDGRPGIILEVNDRTINVYMRATLWLKKPRFPDRPHSNYQDDLIKVYSKTY